MLNLVPGTHVAIWLERIKRLNSVTDQILAFHRTRLSGLDRADSLSQCQSSVDTGLEVVRVGPVLLLLIPVFLDCAPMKKPILRHSLRKSFWLGKNRCPRLDGSYVFTRVLTS